MSAIPRKIRNVESAVVNGNADTPLSKHTRRILSIPFGQSRI